MSTPLPLVGPDYADETSVFGAEGCINLIPEKSETAGTVSQYILRTDAGLTAFVTGLAGATRGAINAGGVFYVVAGESLYSVDSGGNATSLGTILGGGRCILSDNFIPSTRRQVTIMTGERGYVYDTLSGLSEITDANFLAFAKFQTTAFSDSYTFVETEDGFLISAVTDSTVWPPLAFKTAESKPDRVVAVFPVYGDIWVFGTETIEAYRNSGNADDLFQKIQTIEKGCGARYSPANADNGVFWIDQDARVYRANGMNPVRVSTYAIEQYLQSVNYSEAFGFSYVDRGHEFYAFTVPGGKTFLYDCATGLWHRRRSEDMERWRVSCHAKCYGLNLFGDSETGTVWKLDTSAVSEGDGRLVRERITGYLHANGDRLILDRLDIVADTGNALQVGDADQTDPILEMRYSDDGGKNWSNWRQVAVGKIGTYGRRLSFTRLGQFRRRVFHIRITDPIRCDLISVSAELR